MITAQSSLIQETPKSDFILTLCSFQRRDSGKKSKVEHKKMNDDDGKRGVKDDTLAYSYSYRNSTNMEFQAVKI